MYRYFLMIFTLFMVSCNNKEQKAIIPEASKEPIVKKTNSNLFKQSFDHILSNYYFLKDQFVTENIAEIDKDAQLFLISMDSLDLSALKIDSTIIATARTYTLGLSSEMKGLLGEKEIEAKRKAFQMISDQLYDLIRTIKFDGVTIFHLYCSDAFDGEGAYWLNETKDNSNPYLPKKKPNCGSIKDSIYYMPLIK